MRGKFWFLVSVAIIVGFIIYAGSVLNGLYNS
jgi:hypothetical protein